MTSRVKAVLRGRRSRAAVLCAAAAAAAGYLLSLLACWVGGVQPLIHLLGTLSLLAGGLAATVFVALYHLSARWWASEEGWHLMAFTGALGAVLDFVAARTLATPPRPTGITVEAIRLAIYALVAVLLLWRLWMLYRIQIRPRRRTR